LDQMVNEDIWRQHLAKRNPAGLTKWTFLNFLNLKNFLGSFFQLIANLT
jgi:hypothetical protein